MGLNLELIIAQIAIIWNSSIISDLHRAGNLAIFRLSSPKCENRSFPKMF